METINSLMHGFSLALTFENVIWSALGVTLGTLVGVLPGLGPASTIALLMPITMGLEPGSAFIMFAGIYYGAQYGGSTASILLNAPGEAGAMMTAIEGNAMARQGRGGPALATAAIGSFVAGTLATLGTTFLTPLLVELAMVLTAPDYFSLMILALASVTLLLGNSFGKGLMALFAGLLIGTVGLDPQTGQPRFTFGRVELIDGIDIVIIATGLFAIGETLYSAAHLGATKEQVEKIRGSLWLSRDDWARSWKPWLRGTLIGLPLGSIPAGGAELPTALSYMLERKLARNSNEFGKGAIEGVAGPEAANNASAAGAIGPMLALGVPTSSTAAMMLIAFLQYGLQPGPMLMSSNPDLVWALIASLFIGNFLLLILNLPLIGVWVRLLMIPKPLLYSAILVLGTLGVYARTGLAFDVVLLWLIGLVSYAMRVKGIPIVPAILGLILGGMVEQQMRRSLAMSQGDWSIFFIHPISASFLAVAALITATPLITWLISTRGPALQAD